MTSLAQTVSRALLAVALVGTPAAAQETQETLQDKIEAKLVENNCTQEDVDALVEALGPESKAAILAVYNGEADNLPAIPSGNVQADGAALQASLDFAKCQFVKDALITGVSSDLITVALAASEEHPQRGAYIQFAQILADGIELEAARVAAKEGDKETSKAALDEARTRVVSVLQAEEAAVKADAAGRAIGVPSLNLEGE